MLKIFWFILSIALTALLTLACSQGGVVTPDGEPSIQSQIDSGKHILWSYYRFHIDPQIPVIDIVPLRQVENHINVKPFVSPPVCGDCVAVIPTGPYSGNILPLDITLSNPQPVKGYDVRGILISNDFGVGLANPDNFTDLFDDGGALDPLLE